MDEIELRNQCQVYLDGAMSPEARAEFQARLDGDSEVRALVDEQRLFLAFLRRACADERPEAGLADRIRSRIDQEAVSDSPDLVAESERTPPSTSRERAPIAPRFRWRRLVAIAAGFLLIASVAFGIWVRNFECPYMVACAEAHQQASSATVEEVASSDPEELVAYVRQQLKSNLISLPQLENKKLRPVSAGRAHFSKLGPLGRFPDATYVKYEGESKKSVTLLLHPLPDTSPFFMNYDSALDVWRADHKGERVVCWRTSDGRLLCSAVGDGSMSEVLNIAVLARKALDK